MAPLSFLFSFYYRVFLSSHGLNSLNIFSKRKKGKIIQIMPVFSNKNFNKLSIVLSKIKKHNRCLQFLFLELFFILLMAISGAF